MTEYAVPPPQQQILEINVNDNVHRLAVEPRETLLDIVRERLGLTGTKRGCDMGNCGACTVHLDGEAIYSCLVLGVECTGRRVKTIEGLATNGSLDPLQQAFIDTDAFQCGYCTCGQIMSLRALFDDDPAANSDAVLRALSGNLCRCGAYRHILEAAQRVRQGCADGH